MKKIFSLVWLLLGAVAAFASIPDTVVTVDYPATLLQNERHEWDFSTLSPAGETPLVSSIAKNDGTMTITEGESRFYFDTRPEGDYFTGWEDAGKTVSLQRGYNQRPSRLTPGSSYTTPYAATGKYTESGITTAITGAYNLEVLGTGTILLPGGHRFCNATLVKTTDRYHETSCNTTEVHIEKHLWYVSYYPLPVFSAITAAYTYTGGGNDTLRSAYYTANTMPAPEIRGNNDVTVCAGNEVELYATGTGNFSLRNHTLDMPFEPFSGTVTVQPQQTTTYVIRAADQHCYAPPVFDTITVTIETPPVLQLLNRDTTICETVPVELRAQSNYQVLWMGTDINGHTSELTETQVVPSVTTRYTVSTANAACTPATASFNVTVNPVPEPVFVTMQSGRDVIFHITTPMMDGYSYNFNFGDRSVAYNLDMHLHSYPDEPGTYTATLTVVHARNGCARTAAQQIVVDVETGTKGDFIFYPNPVVDIVSVIAPATIHGYQVIEVATGRLCLEKTLTGTETAIQIDMQSLHPGAYILRLQSGIEWLFGKFIKAK